MRRLVVLENEEASSLFDYLVAYRNHVCTEKLCPEPAEEEVNLTIGMLPTTEIELQIPTKTRY